MWKAVALVLGALLVATNAWWIYGTVDRAITQSYQLQVLHEQSNRVLALASLSDAFVQGMNKEAATDLLRRTQRSEEPFEKDGALNTSWVSLTIVDGAVTGVVRDGLSAAFGNRVVDR